MLCSRAPTRACAGAGSPATAPVRPVARRVMVLMARAAAEGPTPVSPVARRAALLGFCGVCVSGLLAPTGAAWSKQQGDLVPAVDLPNGKPTWQVAGPQYSVMKPINPAGATPATGLVFVGRTRGGKGGSGGRK